MHELSIKIENLSKSFKDKCILKSVNLIIKEGEIVIITGSSGEGKTTLLKILAGLESFEGIVKVDSELINFKDQIAYVPQQNSLCDNMNVIDNITLFRKIKLHEDKKTAESNIENLWDLFKISHLRNRYPANLSQGEQQRVSFARAIATNRKIYLLDEVTANLDLRNKDIIANAIVQLSHKQCITIVVTHDLYFAQYLSKNYFTLENCNLTLQTFK